MSIAGVLVVAVIALLVASGALVKKPVKPEVTPAALEAPVPAQVVENVAPLPVQAPPAIEQKAAPAVTETQIPPAPVEKEKAQKYEFQKGMSYVAWTPNGYSNANSPKSIEQMASLGINWVVVLANWYQDKYNSTKIFFQSDKSPSDESIIVAIRKLHELKIKVMLKPHVDLVAGEGKWRGEIGFDTPADWQAWFDSYTAYVLHYAQIAAKENVEMICIGTELTNTTLSQPEQWRNLIQKIREVYKGQLTYAANWDKEFKQIAFWDLLDYVGIDPYFPLVTSANPKVEELKSAWGDWIKVIEEFQKTANKPVILTEIGYKSSRDSADEPWQHAAIGELDLGLQANLYQALLESFWDKPWFYGVYWWYWGTNPRMGGEANKSFTPQNKPVQEVIKEWYNKPIPQKEY